MSLNATSVVRRERRGALNLKLFKLTLEIGLSMHVREFQEMMRRLYFQRDSERGIQETYDWLKDELDELREAIEKGDSADREKEFADVFAWLASLANIARIDLEEATLKKYNDICPKCKKSPCQCTF